MNNDDNPFAALFGMAKELKANTQDQLVKEIWEVYTKFYEISSDQHIALELTKVFYLKEQTNMSLGTKLMGIK